MNPKLFWASEFPCSAAFRYHSPDSAWFYPSWLLGLSRMAHYMRDEYEQALSQADKFTLDQWPGMPLYLAVILGQLGRKEEAKVQLKLLKEIEPGFALNPKDYITRNFLFDDQVEKMMDGLKKAGL